MLTMLTAAALRWMEEHRRRAQLRTLLEKGDDRILRDIGLTRGDIEEALRRPMRDGAREHGYRRAVRHMTLDGLR